MWKRLDVRRPLCSPSVAAVPFSVPPEDRCWLNQNQCGAPPPPVPAEPNPEHSVSGPEPWPGTLPLKYGELVTENCNLSRQRDAGSSHTTEGPEDQKEP
jgi:hypothetical protein